MNAPALTGSAPSAGLPWVGKKSVLSTIQTTTLYAVIVVLKDETKLNVFVNRRITIADDFI